MRVVEFSAYTALELIPDLGRALSFLSPKPRDTSQPVILYSPHLPTLVHGGDWMYRRKRDRVTQYYVYHSITECRDKPKKQALPSIYKLFQAFWRLLGRLDYYYCSVSCLVYHRHNRFPCKR